MGKRGPAPKPDSVRRLEGNPSRRPMKGEPPQPGHDLPTCPSFLSPEARQEWKRVAPELGRLGLLTKLDRASFAAYCCCYGRWRQMQKILAAQGTVYVTARGQLRTRPEVEIAKMERDMMQQFAAEFGLTPTSRSRILIPGQRDEYDPMEEFLTGRGGR